MSADDRLDPELLALAQSMQAEHLPRVRLLMERWLGEESQQPEPQLAFTRMLARLANEFALWGRDSAGPAHDAALAQALQTPGMCRPAGPKASELVLRLARLRGLPRPVQLEAAQAERELLARWGQPRQVSDAEPLPVEDSLLRLRATGEPPEKPLPPVLAYYYLGDDQDTQRDPIVANSTLRCAMHQWAGASTAQFRAAMSMQAADMLWMDRREAIAPDRDDNPYPKVLSNFGALGLVMVSGDVDTHGKLVRVAVVKRAVEVPGIRDARPFAFEGAFDLATLAQARQADWSAAAAKQGLQAAKREFQWALK